MTYKVEIEFSPIYEIISSLSVYINQKANYDLDKKWFKSIEGKLSSEFKELIQDQEIGHSLGYLLLLVWRSPYKVSLSPFLHWLENLTIGEIYELLYSYFREDQPRDLEAFRNVSISLLSSWNEIYQVDQEVLDYLETVSNHKNTMQNTISPEQLVEECTNGIRLESSEVKLVIMIPTYHFAPLNRLFGFKEMALIQFSVDLPKEESEVPLALLRKTKALADEKRLRILQILSMEPKTFSQIVELTKLSKSNLHYHLTMLRTAGLVRITNYMFTQNPDLYEIRPNAFQTHKEDLEAYVYPFLK